MILLARHGQTAYNLQGRFQGHRAVPLDQTGRQQAAQLAESWRQRGDITRLVASPITRALETASFVAAALGIAPEIEPDLVETDCGDWTGEMYSDVISRTPEQYEQFRALEPNFAAPGGETFAAQLDRCSKALDRLRQSTPAGATTAVVAHGNVLRLLAEAELGQTLSHSEATNAMVIEL